MEYSLELPKFLSSEQVAQFVTKDGGAFNLFVKPNYHELRLLLIKDY